jgi:hypothetical protein
MIPCFVDDWNRRHSSSSGGYLWGNGSAPPCQSYISRLDVARRSKATATFCLPGGLSRVAERLQPFLGADAIDADRRIVETENDATMRLER